MFHGQTDPWSPQAARLMWVRKNWRYHDTIAIKDIEAINLVKRVALLADGTCVPITNIFDEDGDETDDINEAVAFVAGRGLDWWSDDVNHYLKVSSN